MYFKQSVVRKVFDTFARSKKCFTFLLGSAMIAGTSLSAFAEETAIPFPTDVNPTGVLQGMAITLAGVVSAALAIWAGFYLVKLAKRLITAHLK